MTAIKIIFRTDIVHTDKLQTAKLSSSYQAVNFFQEQIGTRAQEVVAVIYLDVNCVVISYEEVFVGGLASCHADPKIIFRNALLQSASFIILAHNHPSGNSNPSEDDHALTKRIKNVGELVGVRLLDHLVVTQNDYYSFLDEGRL